jgi:hypothetical protein
MPISKPKASENEQEFVSRCISEIYDEYGQEQSAAICYSVWRENMSEESVEENAQQGGVVSSGFGRTKFIFEPKAKEKMTDFMGRCMSSNEVKEFKTDRINRVAFCYGQYQNKYLMNLAKKWN